jgi:hypothetical protein
MEFEADFFADQMHAVVIGENGGGDAVELLVPADLDQALEQFGAQAVALVLSE